MAQELKPIRGGDIHDLVIFGDGSEIYHAETLYYLKNAADEALNEKDAEIRRLQRALWVTRTAWAKSEKDRWDSHVDCGNKRNRKDPAFVKTGKLLEVSEWRKLWADNESKCRAKAEEYK